MKNRTVLSKSIPWSQVTDLLAVTRYYHQRLGDNYRQIPCVMIDRAVFMEHFIGDRKNGILGKMLEVDPSAAHEVCFYYTNVGSVIATFQIDTPNPGARFIACLQTLAAAEFPSDLLGKFKMVSCQCNL
jgi:hypothetical protein